MHLNKKFILKHDRIKGVIYDFCITLSNLKTFSFIYRLFNTSLE